MNTPKTPKRFSGYSTKPDPTKDGLFVGGLYHEPVSAAFADVVTSFEVLEGEMPRLLAVLLGGYDINTAGYVLRTIRNPSAKRELLRQLLELAPINKELPILYDDMISEYGRLATERNQLVHGKWFTSREDPPFAMVSRKAAHGEGMLNAERVEVEELEVISSDIRNLYRSIILETAEILASRRRQAKDRA